MAQEFVNTGDIDYLDRMNTDALFRELHLSQSAAFNASSGALKGLLGRLDFLVVIDSAEPTTARVRLIDVESGAVRALETCKRKSSFLGLGQDSPPDCLRTLYYAGEGRRAVEDAGEGGEGTTAGHPEPKRRKSRRPRMNSRHRAKADSR